MRLLVCALASGLAGLVACGSIESAGTAPDAGAEASPSFDATADAIADAGADASLVPEGLTKVVVTAKGGGPYPFPPEASTCTLQDETYTLTLPTQELAWQICESTDAGPLAFRTGQKTLTPSEYAVVDGAMHALRLSTTKLCGADKADGKITFTSPAGDVTYRDDFYACFPKPGDVFVDGWDEVYAPLYQYAR